MPATYVFKVDQLKNIIATCSKNEQVELSKFLDRMVLKEKWRTLIRRKMNVPITNEEITNEVALYRKGRKK